MRWRWFVIALLLSIGCGQIVPVADLVVKFDGGSLDGAHPEVSQADTGTESPNSEVSQADARLDEPPSITCIGGDAGAVGFAYNPGCDGGTTLPTSCHAGCTLDGARFVGCAWDDRVDAGYVVCHASCGECP